MEEEATLFHPEPMHNEYTVSSGSHSDSPGLEGLMKQELAFQETTTNVLS